MAKNKNQKVLGVVVENEMAAELEGRAESLHISASRYCRMVLEDWIKSGKKITLQET